MGRHKTERENKSGEEHFTLHGLQTELTVKDFWSIFFSDLYEIRSKVAVYLVAHKLGITSSQEFGYWSAQSICYKKKRIEIRATCGAGKAGESFGDRNTVRHIDVRVRETDIYVFCLNESAMESDLELLELERWKFYVVPEWYIRSECGDKKTITREKVKRLVKETDISGLKRAVDSVIKLDKESKSKSK